MTRHTSAAVFAFVFGLNALITCVVAGEPPAWKPIADGKSLAGWHKNGLGDWTVEDGAYVGRSNKEALYGHLVSDETYQDFTVRFKFQCPSGDSGFFIRTQMEEPDKTNGLQIQVGPCGSGTGGIYESYGRGWLQKPTAQQEAFCYRQTGWNEMIISADGPRITVHVNGFKTADLNDPDVKQAAGVLALQMHSRVVNQTMFKDLAILERGEIVPRAFLYDAVDTVRAAADGSVRLPACAAMTTGPAITYRPDTATAGPLTEENELVWTVQTKRPRTYAIWLELPTDAPDASNRLVIDAGEKPVVVRYSGMSGTESVLSVVAGQLPLRAGLHRITLRGNAESSGMPPLFVHQVQLVPVE